MINDETEVVIKRWIKQHALIGGSGEGRVFGDGVYSLLLIREAAIVSGAEDTEICPDPAENNDNVGESPLDSGNVAEVEKVGNLTMAVLEAKEDSQDFEQEDTTHADQIEATNGQEPTTMFGETPSQAQGWKFCIRATTAKVRNLWQFSSHKFRTLLIND